MVLKCGCCPSQSNITCWSHHHNVATGFVCSFFLCIFWSNSTKMLCCCRFWTEYLNIYCLARDMAQFEIMSRNFPGLTEDYDRNLYISTSIIIVSDEVSTWRLPMLSQYNHWVYLASFIYSMITIICFDSLLYVTLYVYTVHDIDW